MIPEQCLPYPYLMRFIVTGGMGFIGSHFIDILLEHNHEILLLDKMTYAANPLNLSSEKRGMVNLREVDIADTLKLNECVQTFGSVDYIVNFAAESHVDRSIENSNPFIQSNIKGTVNLLELLRNGAAKKLIQVSTDEVYGSIDTGSWTELSNTLPNSPYSASKASAEMMCNAYSNTFGLNVVITRCANNFGPRQSLEKFIPKSIFSILNDSDVKVYGNGQNRREWLNVIDHCEVLYLLAINNCRHKVYNIGGTEFSNLEIVEKLSKALDKNDSKIKFASDRLGHDFRYSVISERIENEYGWKPRFTFEETINSTVDWYKNNPEWVEESMRRLAL